MNHSNTTLCSLTVAFMLACGSAYAQTTPAYMVTNQPLNPIASASDNKAKPLERILEKDVPWKKRVWREIDGNDAKNKDIFISKDENRSNVLANILNDGISKGAIKAYSNTTENFSTVLSAKEIAELTPINSYKFRLKEDWLFVSKDNGGSGHIEVRIVGIAPMMEVVTADGTKSEQPAYWVYYPDSRNFLHQNKVTDAKHEGYTWDQYFEGRHFTSKIDKVFETRDELGKEEQK